MNLRRLVSRIYKALFHRIYKRPKQHLFLYFNFLNRLDPVNRNFGFDRGQPIDRYYIDAFLSTYRTDIQGRVLEIQESIYTKRFGGTTVAQSDVLDIIATNPNATIVGNLETGEGIPSDAFDCMIITHTYQYIFDLRSAVLNSYRALKPGGILLAAFPGITKVSRDNMISRYTNREDEDGYSLLEYWRFTESVVRRLFEETCPHEDVTVKAYGNVFTASAFLYGIASQELKKKKLKYHDPDYPVLISLRVAKSVNSMS